MSDNIILCSAIIKLQTKEFPCTKEAGIGSIYCQVHAEKIVQDQEIKSNQITNIDDRVIKLLEINSKMPEQRTLPWYEFRKSRLTASPAAAYLLITDYEYNLSEQNIICLDTQGTKLKKEWIGKKHCSCFNGYKHEIRQQVAPDPWTTSAFMEHGVKYESIIRDIYEATENKKVLEFGIMPHSTISWLAASPDGICTCGTMVEIKAPSRDSLTKQTILQYWIQMQLQMECCDLEECDFVEGIIREYKDVYEYYDDKYYNEDGEFEYYLNSQGCPKGIVINIIHTNTKGIIEKRQYAYPPAMTFNNKEEEDAWIIYWIRNKVNEKHDNAYKWLVTNSSESKENNSIRFMLTYYYVEKWEVQRIKRDRKWFELRKGDLLDTWNIILKYRAEGLPDEFKKKTRKQYDTSILFDTSTVSLPSSLPSSIEGKIECLFNDDDADNKNNKPNAPIQSKSISKIQTKSQSKPKITPNLNASLMRYKKIPTIDLNMDSNTQPNTQPNTQLNTETTSNTSENETLEQKTELFQRDCFY